jgi:hypothetical protein
MLAFNETVHYHLDDDWESFINLPIEIFKHGNDHFHGNYSILEMLGVLVDVKDSLDEVESHLNVALWLSISTRSSSTWVHEGHWIFGNEVLE